MGQFIGLNEELWHGEVRHTWIETMPGPFSGAKPCRGHGPAGALQLVPWGIAGSQEIGIAIT